MDYYGFSKLLELTQLPEGTICRRLYNSKVASSHGVELDDEGHKVVSEVNFRKYKWDTKWKRGKKANM